ncbi:hypothetical protein MJO28_004954 [Puccinia striiformis f. sp. tritici]|uniref:Uncharacterized protein n=1 Tax=Puccinia striiformis f. sp. tritici TaxID=168172 RepID=A0ACC0EJC6_9BASI|nr:hypothetical protein MJO28_004954 [Puccinia striiformis f. sp. tritici]
MADSLPDLQELDAALPLPPKIENEIQELEKHLSGYVDEDIDDINHWSKITNLAQEVADQLRDLRFRQSVGTNTKIFPYIIDTINKVIANKPKKPAYEMLSPILGVTQLLRIVGNSVHTSGAYYSLSSPDHTTKQEDLNMLRFVFLSQCFICHQFLTQIDDNRKRVLAAGGAPALKSLLDMYVDMAHDDKTCYEEEIRITLIVTTNFSVDFQPAQDSLAELGLTASISRLIEMKCSESRQVGVKFPTVFLSTLAQMIVYFSLEDDPQEDYSSPPKEENLNVSTVVLCTQVLQTLVEHASPGRFTQWLFVTTDRLSGSFTDDERAPMWMTLAMFLQSGHQGIEAAPGIYQGEVKYNLYSVIKAQIIQALVLAMAHVQVTSHGRSSMYALLAGWAQDDRILKERADLVIMCGLWLSNLACGEEACRILVEDYQILDSLANVFKIWSPTRLGVPDDSTLCKAQPGQQAQILHGWCGLARNLAVADTYKNKLGQIGMVDYALECLRSEFDIVEPLNGTAAALLRHLCRNSPENVERVLVSGRVDRVLSLAKRVEQPFLILETSRLLSTLINAAAQMEESKSENFQSGWNVLHSKTTVDTIARFSYFATASQHFVLVNEALISLALLAVRPNLIHFLCSSLLTIQDDSEPPAKSAVKSDGAGDKDEKCKTALDALLCLAIPIDKPESKTSQQENCDCPKKDEEEVREPEIIKLDEEGSGGNNEDLENAPEEVKRLIKTIPIPIQMRQNLFTVLKQIGEEALKSPKDRRGTKVIQEVNQSDIKQIQDTLLKHFKIHLSDIPLDSNSLAPDHEFHEDPLPIPFLKLLETWGVNVD